MRLRVSISGQGSVQQKTDKSIEEKPQALDLVFKKALRAGKRMLTRLCGSNERGGARTNYGVYYSQEGEDAVLRRLLAKNLAVAGTYVDVGCNDPWRYSNTAALYKAGWSGVAIDPNPHYAEQFARERPRDVFVNSAIGARDGSIKYFCFAEPLFNTCIESAANAVVRAGYQSAFSTNVVPVKPLRAILLQAWPSGKKVDVLSIDVEGMDEEVIKSHDFEMFPATWIIAEVPEGNLDVVESCAVGMTLRNLGYEPVSKLWRSVIFRRK